MRFVRTKIFFLVLLAVILQSIAWLCYGAEYVPRDAYRYQRQLIGEARAVWGMTAPIATFAAQIHQESKWNPDAKSAFAGGLTQFTPATATWIAGAYPKELGEENPFNPGWALRALVRYDKHLWDRTNGRSNCDRMAFTLSGYNGGSGWVQRDKKLTATKGGDPEVWFGSAGVEPHNAGRAPQFFKENRGYPRRILCTLQVLYEAWGEVTHC